MITPRARLCEYERRKAKDEQRLRQSWGLLGGLAIPRSEEKPSTKVWVTGAVGEKRLGARVEGLLSNRSRSCTTDASPGSTANFDDIAITLAGV